MFCERNTYVLAEKFTFSSTVQLAGALGAKLLGVEVDDEGMIPESLDAILNDWDPAYYDGAPKPFLLYTISSGQNPTATTQSLKRRKAIYAVAEKHDLFLLEDDPYYYLQMNPFTGSTEYNPPSEPPSFEQYKSGLVPSFLSLDISGRVLRIDTFSKIIAPGARVGWVTGPAQIIERYKGKRNLVLKLQADSVFSLCTTSSKKNGAMKASSTGWRIFELPTPTDAMSWSRLATTTCPSKSQASQSLQLACSNGFASTWSITQRPTKNIMIMLCVSRTFSTLSIQSLRQPRKSRYLWPREVSSRLLCTKEDQ